MAFLVQDDNGSVLEANAYESVAEFKAYHDDRGGVYGTYTDAQIEKAIVLSTDFLDARYSFAGLQRSVEQGTQFPRYPDGTVPTGIPRALKHATSLLALRSLGGAALLPDPASGSGQVVESTKKVGPLEVTTKYAADSVASEAPSYPDVDLLLRNAGLLGSSTKRIFRG